MRRFVWQLRLFLIGAVLTQSLFCKEQTGTQQQSTFKSRSELVLVPTIVRDRAGAPVRSLKAGDFTVLEDGKEQKVAVFEEIRTTPLRGQKPTLGRSEFSNIATRDAQSSASTIILLDHGGGMGWESFLYSRHRLLTYFGGRPKLKVPTALVAFNGYGLETLQDFTTDPERLEAAVGKLSWLEHKKQMSALRENVYVQGFAELKAAATPIPIKLRLPELESLEPVDGPAFLGMDECSSEARDLRDSVRTLELVAQSYAGLPGRKNLVWMSDLFPHPLHDPTGGHCVQLIGTLLDRLPQVWRVFTDAQIAIYPVSTEGMALNITPGNLKGLVAGHFNLETRGKMRDIANQTGGRAFYGRNDLENGYAEAVEDLAHYYLVGYYRDRAGSKPRQWHDLNVKVAREGVRIQARNGFYTVPENESSESERRYDLAFSRSSPVDFTELPFKVRLDTSAAKRSPENRMLNYTVLALPGAVTIDADNSNHVLLDIVTDIYNDKGERTLTVNKNLEARLKPDSAQRLAKGGVTFNSGIELEKGTYTLRFFVRDALSGRMGSLTAPFTVQ